MMPPDRPDVYSATPFRISGFVQALLARSLFFVVRLMPIDIASAVGGWLGRYLGPLFGVTKVARKNLTRAFPEKTAPEIESIVRGMWRNLGRSVMEFPHVDRLRFEGPSARCEIVGAGYIDQLRGDGAPGLLVSGHFANWEVLPFSVASRGIPLHIFYRAPNNPMMEPLFARRIPGQGELIPKGASGAKQALKLLKAGQHLGILIDQKMNDGIAVPFFGRDAMTAPAVAHFAYRYNCPVVPVRIERTGGSHFRVTANAPLVMPDTGDRQADVLQLMTDINALLETWIRDRPEQWLWVHRRWPD
jgi:KDO2-lipid IV(A) lauroyltransferase